MGNKLRELSKPVAWALKEHVWATGLCGYVWRDKLDDEAPDAECESVKDVSPLYSQEYVSALLADNEAKDKRIAELEQDELATRASSRAVHEAQENHINQQQDRIDSLEKKNAGLGRWLAAVEKRLAAPVRFPDCDTAAVSIMAHWLSDEEVNAWVKGIEFAKQQIRAAGFTVEGDE